MFQRDAGSSKVDWDFVHCRAKEESVPDKIPLLPRSNDMRRPVRCMQIVLICSVVPSGNFPDVRRL
jgi:hypothetical protein